MNLTIPDEILQAAQLSATDIKRELLLVQHHIPAALKFKKLSKLQERDCIVGDPEDLVHFDWAKEWNNIDKLEKFPADTLKLIENNPLLISPMVLLSISERLCG